MPRVTIVVPCYNEAKRLDGDRFVAHVDAHDDTSFLFVDDGSTDETSALLADLVTRRPGRLAALDLACNGGKHEAVRRGMLAAAEGGAAYLGYWDADLATPLEEIPRFVEVLDERADVDIVFGARVQLLGRDIRRRVMRHYLGRVFATAVSLTLDLAIYDTQCGAKLFRAGPQILVLFGEPFLARWIFDVEVLARLTRHARVAGAPGPAQTVRELPLLQWRDQGGSKLRAGDYVRAVRDLVAIHWRYLRCGRGTSRM